MDRRTAGFPEGTAFFLGGRLPKSTILPRTDQIGKDPQEIKPVVIDESTGAKIGTRAIRIAEPDDG